LDPQQALRAKLAEIGELVDQLVAERDQLRSELEQTTAERRILPHAYADLAFPAEELDRARQQSGGCPLGQIMGQLHVLAEDRPVMVSVVNRLDQK
jgi:hypothetical protein